MSAAQDKMFRPRLPKGLEAAVKARAREANMTANDLVILLLERAVLRRALKVPA